jgi:aryl-alcohol dehydrogenase-like predicted oxidoreductase
MLCLRPFRRDQLPLARPWFADADTERWLGGPRWPDLVLDLADSPLGEFRGAIETGRYEWLAWEGDTASASSQLTPAPSAACSATASSPWTPNRTGKAPSTTCSGSLLAFRKDVPYSSGRPFHLDLRYGIDGALTTHRPHREKRMQYRTLGRTGIKVSPYALGAMMFGAIGNPDHDDSIRIIHTALDAGINFIDTADAYSYGESEEIVGKALKGRRDDIVVATKLNRPMGDDPNQRGNSRRWIMTAAENSLRRLQTDHIDLYQIHRPDPDTDIEETLSALSDLIHSGKVRAIGSSTMPASDIVEAQWVAERRGLERFRTEQPTYSILSRGIEAEVLPVAQRYGMGTLVWSPLAQGMLTGRIRKGQQTDLRRTALFKHLSDERRLDAVEQIIPLAEQAGLPMTHLAMAFAIAHPGVTSAIIGPRTMEHLDDLLAGVDVTLSDEILDRIDEIVPPGTDVGTLDMAYRPPAIQRPSLRRRPVAERAAA